MASRDEIKDSLIEKTVKVFERLEGIHSTPFEEARKTVVEAIEESFHHLQTHSQAIPNRFLDQLDDAINLQVNDSNISHRLETEDPDKLSTKCNELWKKYKKVLRECTQLKTVNKDLYTRLSRAQVKLREWNQFAAPHRISSSMPSGSVNGPPMLQNWTKDDLNGYQPTPALPAPRCNVNPNHATTPSGLTNTLRHNSRDHTQSSFGSRAPMILDLLGSDNYDSSTRASSVNRSPGLKRKREDFEISHHPPLPRSGDVSNPVAIKSESSSSSFEKMDKPEDIPSSNPEDLSRSRRPPTPKRAKVRVLLDDKTSLTSTHVSSVEDRHPSSNRCTRPSNVLPSPKSTSPYRPDDERGLPVLSDKIGSGSDTPHPIESLARIPLNQHNRTPLRDLDQNVRVLPRTSKIERLSTHDKRSGADAVHHIAEDGERMLQRSGSNQDTSTEAIKVKGQLSGEDRLEVFRRLNQLLSTPSPRPELPQQPQTNRRRGPVQQKTPLNEARPITSSHAPPSERRNAQPSVPRQPTPSAPPSIPRTRAPPPPLPSRPPKPSPLRTRPIDLLNLSDFKINPARNSGLTYAYTDVVRDRAVRKCLPGCTRPECCGTQFRALATTLPTTDLDSRDNANTSSSAAAADDDDELLASFLGHASASQLAHLTHGERAELLEQARTKQAADKYGKMHRHQWQAERPRSPPGFWRTDFPATQEAEDDRIEADRIVRDMVRGRWREAMKGERRGGLWLFRDE